MAQTLIDFSAGQITDGTAGGADNVLSAGGLVFTISAQGNWSANFDNGRFNFAEDPAYGGEQFSIAITSATGALIDFYDYQISVNADPLIVNGWSPGLGLDGTTWYDDNIHGDGVGPYYYRAIFAGNVPAMSRGTSLSLQDLIIPETTTTGTMSFWLDNITIDANHRPVVTNFDASDAKDYVSGSQAAILVDTTSLAAVTDADNTGWSGGQIRFTLSGVVAGEDALGLQNQGTGAGQIGISGTIVTFGGTAIGTMSGGGAGSSFLQVALNGNASGAAVEAIIHNLTYANMGASPTGTRTVSVTVRDAEGGNSTTTSPTVNLVAANDAPVTTTSGGTGSFTEGDAPVAIDTGLTVSDLDNGTLASATVQITGNFHSGQDVLAFANTSSAAFGNIDATYSSLTGVLTLTSPGGTATVAQWQAALRTVTYLNTSEAPTAAARTISFSTNDGTSDSAPATKTIDVGSVNDAPQISAPGAIAFTEDTAAAITGISFSDADAGGSSVTVTFSVPSGSLSAVSGSGVTAGGTGTGLTLTGTEADINAFIAAANVTFTPAANATGNVILTTSITDGGNTGSGGAQTAAETTALQITAVNDAPTVSAPAVVSISEDTATAITGISFADADAGSGTVTVTFSVASGSLSAQSAGGVTVSGTGTSLEMSGSLADINAFIAGSNVTFTPVSNSTSNVVLTTEINDLGNAGSGGAKSDASTTTLVLTAVNDAPVNDVPVGQSVLADGALVFSIANGNLISIADVDAGSGMVVVTLTAEHGQLTLGGTAGLTFIAGTGTSDSGMTFAGSLSDINVALNGLVFSPSPGYSGDASLKITTNDQGHSGSGGAQSDSDTITIAVVSPAPKVLSVDAAAPDGVYKAGDTITLTVTFDGVVNVDTTGGTPTLLLETGATDRLAAYVSGSGSNTLSFSYTVQAGDLAPDLDYAGISALAANGGAIRSATNVGADLTLPTPGGANSIAAQNNIVVDGVGPTVTSVGVPAAGTYKFGDSLDFAINFHEAVTVDTTNGVPRLAVMLDMGGTAYAEYIAGSGSTALAFRLTVTDNQADWTGITLGPLTLNGATISDSAGNSALLTLNNIAPTSSILVDGIVNDAPALTGDLRATVAEGGTYKLTTADLGYSDPDDTAAGVSFNVSNAINGSVLVNGSVAASFTAAQLAAGLVSFRHNGSETTAASFRVVVEDGNEDNSAPTPATFNFTVNPVNDAPIRTGDLRAAVAEGGTYKLTTADLGYSDPDDTAAGVSFNVSNAVNGSVLVNGSVAASFTAAQLAAGLVSFRHNGSETTAASFRVVVEDGNEDNSAPTPATFNFTVNPVNDAPIRTGDLRAAVAEGGTYKLTTTDLGYSDPDDTAAGVSFNVSNAVNGSVLVNGSVAAGFTAAQLAAGLVSFRHNGSETTAASFRVVVEDGNEDNSAPTPATFNFTVNPVNDAPSLTLTQHLTRITEDASTGTAQKVATLVIADDAQGTNLLSLSGADAALFEIRGNVLWLKAGARLDFETNPYLDVTIGLDDPSVGTGLEATKTVRVSVTDAIERYIGSAGSDRLTGTAANETFDGGAGNDVINGAAGNDTIIGGAGADLLTGGAGNDIFVFKSTNDSAPGFSGYVNNVAYGPASGAGHRDTVTDFANGFDRLDLSAIDANTGAAGNQAFTWRGTGEFSRHAGELIYKTFNPAGTLDDKTIIYGDVNGDGRADFQIELSGLKSLATGDFLL
ncbi:cadherin-like domain-containing protein [Sinorhizobium sp. M4_45]|uniref:beta strand repeat-containing protein n=1 Tax=Sinorhizobium sp. M4_45 TaxID=2037901 RepID=UPI000C9AA357|nr:cadherin-like domain-containing protein [Sinorhizobium sp. M4_45]PND29124.1 hypothetical protein CN933_03440 [Sinorhizobium sp. M4_45]